LFADQEKHAATGDIPSVKDSLRAIGSYLDEQRRALMNAQTAEAALGRSALQQSGGPQTGPLVDPALVDAHKQLRAMAGVVNTRKWDKSVQFYTSRVRDLQSLGKTLHGGDQNAKALFKSRVSELYNQFRSERLLP
jgi:hypothetical protein